MGRRLRSKNGWKNKSLKQPEPQLTKQNKKVVYVNLWGARGTNDFEKALARALNEENKIVHKIKEIYELKALLLDQAA